MKTSIIWLVIAAGLLSLPVRASEAPAETPKQEVKVDYKDAFLGLVLEKTKLYSGKMENALGSGLELAQKEAPKLAYEYLRWKLLLSITIFSANALVLIVASILICLGVKRNWGDGLFGLMALVFGALPVMISIFYLCSSATDIIQIKTAPRIYLIEQAASLIYK